MKKQPQNTSAVGLRDGAGHLIAGVAADLAARSRGEVPEEHHAFFRAARTSDPLAEHLGESFVAGAMGGEDVDDEAPDAADSEEKGGPFIETAGETEFARGTDASNPRDATREPFPLT